MKHALFLLLLTVALIGCEKSNDVTAPVQANAEPTKAGNDPAKTALLPGMTASAKKLGDWASLPENEKSSFLQFHDNNAEQAQKHYESLVQMARDGDI